MSEVKRAKCPSCHRELPGTYRVDLHEMTTRGYCSYCHEPYTIVYGNGKIKSRKEY